MEELFSARKETKERTRSKGYLGRKNYWTRHSQSDVEDHADILDLSPSKILEHRNEVEQFIVVGVREPAADGYHMLRVEDVGRRGVVDDDRVAQVTANLREVFDIVALVVVATLSEQPMVDHIMNVKLVQQWVTILGDRRSKHHHFVEFANPFHELIHTGSLDHIDVVILTFDLDWNGKIGTFENL